MATVTYRRILAAVDFSAPSRAALRHAIGLAKHHGAHLDVIYVIEDSFRAALPWAEDARKHVAEMRRLETKVATAKLEKFVPAAPGVRVERTVKNGDVDEEVRKFAKRRRAELIVIGNVGRRQLGALLLGSTAADIVRTSRIPVLLVPQTR